MEHSRTKNSVKNICFSLGLYVLLTLSQFANRTVFIDNLSSGFLGLNGLFKNIISLLALSELGIGSAMSYALYEPLEKHNYEKIKSIMFLYKRLYSFIGIFILVIGFLLGPFLPYLIKDIPNNVANINIYFWLYLLSSGLSYFSSYKLTIIICDQKQFIASLITTGTQILLSTIQIGLMILTKSYFVYVSAMIAATLLQNMLIYIVSHKYYPFLSERNVQKLETKTVSSIKKNVFSMLFHKLGFVVVMSTDNIIISKFVGLQAVGIYSNYTLIINAVNNVIVQFFNALVASVGNLVITESREYSEKIFNRILFLNSIIVGFASVCLICFLNPFITLWIGEKYILDFVTVLFAVISFYLTGMRKTVLMFKDASGLFWQDRYKPIIESIINTVASVPLAICYGIKGVLLGTIISNLVLSFWFEGYVVYKNLFHKKVLLYLKQQVVYFIITFLIGSITLYISRIIEVNRIVDFIVLFIVCIIFTVFLYIVIYYKSDNFKYFLFRFKKLKNR